MEQSDILPDRYNSKNPLTRDQVVESLRRPHVGRRRRSNDDARIESGAVDSDGNPWLSDIKELVPAAVLIPLVARDNHLGVLLTRRTDHLARHAGQVSFPGGRMDATDESAVHTALRETEEEIGLHRRHVELIGDLDEYVVGTGYLVKPVVGIIIPPFELTPQKEEVADMFEAPLDYLMDPENYQRRHRENNGVRRYFYAIAYENYDIWGATAGMLRNLSERLGHL